MNVIKIISSRTRVLLLMGIYFSASGGAIANSVFISPLGEKVDSELDSISVSLNSENGWLLGGYKEEEDGNNVPYISLVPIDGAKARYWPLTEGYASQLFEREGESYVLLSTGKTLKIESMEISLADFQFKPNSLLVTDEPELIACTKIGWAKLSSSTIASCYRVDGAWDIDVYWTRMDVPPKVCGGDLKVLVSSDRQRKWEVLVLDQKTGKQLSSKKVDKPEVAASICQL